MPNTPTQYTDDAFITPTLIADIHSALDKGLVKGIGRPIEGEMCVEALICHKLGLPHSDYPPCVGAEIRNAKINLNDCDWSSDHARAEGMRKLAIAQLGSNVLDQKEFQQQLKLLSYKRVLPFLIQKHYDRTKDEKLLEYKLKFEQLTAIDDDDELWREFYNYYYYYNYNNYNYYYYYYYNNYYNYYYKYNYYYFGDEFLLIIADTILQVLIDMKSPGVKWL